MGSTVLFPLQRSHTQLMCSAALKLMFLFVWPMYILRKVKNIEIEKSAIASHVWNENHRINKEPKLLKQLHRRKELNVWEKIFIYKNDNKILNFEIPGEKDLIKKFVHPLPEKRQIAMQQPEAPVGN